MWHERLGLRWPLVQAPMAGVQGADLAVAVARAGALGSLPAAMLGVDALRRELESLRDAGVASYNVNFFCHDDVQLTPQRDAQWRQRLARHHAEWGVAPPTAGTGPARAPVSDAVLDVVEPFRPRVVSFHFGLPSAPLLARVKAWGAWVLSSATTVQEALWLQDHGADAVIAQGIEAGGHRGHFLSDELAVQPGLMSLLPQVVRAVRLPVIAAGGLGDAGAVAAAFASGAQGVQVGSAFLDCHEAVTSVAHRRALRRSPASPTALTNVFTGRPARGIVNRAMLELGPMSADAPPFPHAAAAWGPVRAAAERAGSGDFSPLWCGQAGCGFHELPAAEVVAALAVGCPVGP